MRGSMCKDDDGNFTFPPENMNLPNRVSQRKYQAFVVAINCIPRRIKEGGFAGVLIAKVFPGPAWIFLFKPPFLAGLSFTYVIYNISYIKSYMHYILYII